MKSAKIILGSPGKPYVLSYHIQKFLGAWSSAQTVLGENGAPQTSGCCDSALPLSLSPSESRIQSKSEAVIETSSICSHHQEFVTKEDGAGLN